MDKIAPAADAFPRLWTSGYDNQITTKLPRGSSTLFPPHGVWCITDMLCGGVGGGYPCERRIQSRCQRKCTFVEDLCILNVTYCYTIASCLSV